ncbi:MAG: hypothetical protein Q9185_004758 [Variospora sp. 1 TL-2023]
MPLSWSRPESTSWTPLEELLNDIVPLDEELEPLIQEPLGTLWKKPQYDQKLRDRLDRLYKLYLKTLPTLVQKLHTLREKLGIDESGAVATLAVSI